MMLDRIVEVFCEVDDFCQAFVPQWEASLLGPGGPAPRGPQPGLSPTAIQFSVVHTLSEYYILIIARFVRGYAVFERVLARQALGAIL
jgi:hypothetical protein